MTELDKLVQIAFSTEGAQDAVNKFYVALFRTKLYMPAQQQPDDLDEPFIPLYLQEEEKYFISVFDSEKRLKIWAGNEASDLDHVEIVGSDVIRCIGSKHVYLSLNPGTDYYKEFSPEEIQRLKIMLAKIDKLKSV